MTQAYINNKDIASGRIKVKHVVHQTRIRNYGSTVDLHKPETVL